MELKGSELGNNQTNPTYVTEPQANSVTDDCLVFYNIAFGIIVATSIHVIVCLLLYEKKKNKRDSNGNRSRKNKSTTLGRWLRFLCIFGPSLCVCCAINDLVLFNYKPRSDFTCTIGCTLGDTLFLLLDTIVYLFLWLRQYIIYKQFKVKRRSLVWTIRILRVLVLVMILSLFIVMESLLIFYRQFVYNEETDKCESIVPRPDIDVSASLWTTGSIMFHFALVALFVVPLWHHSTLSKKRSKAYSGETRAFSNTQGRLRSLKIRCLVISLICTMSDLTIMLIATYIMSGGLYTPATRLLFNFNIFLNVTAIIVSFHDWRQMLFPWFKSCHSGQRRESKVTVLEGKSSNSSWELDAVKTTQNNENTYE